MRDLLGSIPITAPFVPTSDAMCAVRLPGPQPISRIPVAGVMLRRWRMETGFVLGGVYICVAFCKF